MLLCETVDDDEGGAGHDQFARALEASKPARIREIFQALDLGLDLVPHGEGGAGFVLGDDAGMCSRSSA